jgi:VCBS repeat protein
MRKTRLRRAGLPAAVAVIAATVAVSATVWLGGNADAATSATSTDNSAANASTLAAAKSLQSGTSSVATAARKRLKAKGLKAAVTDELNFGDITGDGNADLGAIDKTGMLWIYPGKSYVYPGTGPRSTAIFSPRFSVGKGWNTFTSLVRHGDFNNDGKQDVLARNAAGKLYFYAGTGARPAVFKAGVVVGSSWQTYKSIIGVGDYTSDGKDDLVAQKTNGDLMLYSGTGDGLHPFTGTLTKIGSSFKGDMITAIGDLNGDGRTDLYYRDAAQQLWLYPSQLGASPIGPRDPDWLPVDFTGVRQLIGAGNLESDAGKFVLPDQLVQGGNILVLAAADTAAKPDNFTIGSGWDALKLF